MISLTETKIGSAISKLLKTKKGKYAAGGLAAAGLIGAGLATPNIAEKYHEISADSSLGKSLKSATQGRLTPEELDSLYRNTKAVRRSFTDDQIKAILANKVPAEVINRSSPEEVDTVLSGKKSLEHELERRKWYRRSIF